VFLVSNFCVPAGKTKIREKHARALLLRPCIALPGTLKAPVDKPAAVG
jgi:hypothetical protein